MIDTSESTHTLANFGQKPAFFSKELKPESELKPSSELKSITRPTQATEKFKKTNIPLKELYKKYEIMVYLIIAVIVWQFIYYLTYW